MGKYFVNIAKRPLGINFVHGDDGKSLIVNCVSENSMADKLGILVGDILIAINFKSVLQMKSQSSLDLFLSHSLPFTVTFKQSIPKQTTPQTPKKEIPFIDDCEITEFNAYASNSSLQTISSTNSFYSDFTDPFLVSFGSHMHDVISSDPDDDDDAEISTFANLLKANENNYSDDDHKSQTDDPFHFKMQSDTDDDSEEDMAENEIKFNVSSPVGKFGSHKNHYLVSSNGFNSGIHEWTIEILECDTLRQEIGVISKYLDDENQKIKVNKGGVCDTPEFGARAVYGCILESNKFYYASFNENNSSRCSKDLSSHHKIGWCTGDELKIRLDLNKGNIKFYLNDKKIRKTISIQKNKTYFPIISYFGHCKYKLVHYK